MPYTSNAYGHREASVLMPVSVVLFYNEKHKYGFIKAEPCNIFYHASAVEGEPVQAGDAVRYDAEQEGRSSPRALSVRLVDAAAMTECDRVFGSA